MLCAACNCLSGSVEGLVESHQSCRKYRIVGFLVAQKDLMDPTFLLGVHMDGHTNSRKVHIFTLITVSWYESIAS